MLDIYPVYKYNSCMFISKKILIVFSVLYLFGAFFHLGNMYFQHEEPRRAIIALEMNYNKDYVQPTVLGRPYFKKPPLHNIVIAAFFKVFGTNEFSARLVSILSLILFGFLIFIVLKNVIGIEASIFAAFSFLTSFITYFSYGMIAETDMFFSLLVFCSMISLFVFKKHGIVSGSIFASLAFLTKGFPALHYFYFTLFAYALMEKKIKDAAFLKQTFLASAIIFGSFVLWLLSFSTGDIHKINYALGFLISESGSRVLSIEKIFQSALHALIFPIKFWYHFLPFSLFVLLFFIRDFRKEFKNLMSENAKIRKLVKFSFAAFIPNFLLYDLIPDGRIRYTLALFAFFAFFVGIVYYELEYIEFDVDFKKIGTFALILLALIGAVGAVFVYEFTKTEDYIVSALAALVSVIFIYLLRKLNNRYDTIFVSCLSFAVILKILYLSIYFSYLFTYYTNYRLYGNSICKIALKNNPKYVMSDAVNLRLFFYVERCLNMPIHPVCKKCSGTVISKHRQKMDLIRDKIDTPKGVYYIGRKIGGM